MSFISDISVYIYTTCAHTHTRARAHAHLLIRILYGQIYVLYCTF